MAGDEFSYGDIPVGIMIYRYMQLIPERPATPNLDRWYAAISSRAAFKEQIARRAADVTRAPTLALPSPGGRGFSPAQRAELVAEPRRVTPTRSPRCSRTLAHQGRAESAQTTAPRRATASARRRSSPPPRG